MVSTPTPASNWPTNDSDAAGNYAVLPARYAVLPGALLLTPDRSGTEIVPGLRGQTSATLPLVAGRIGSAGGTVRDTAWQGYRLEAGQDWRLRGEYRETRASEFFAGGTGTVCPTMPAPCRWRRAVRFPWLDVCSRACPTVVVAQRWISPRNIWRWSTKSARVVDRVEIRAADLNAFGAQSLLLGGQRHRQLTAQ